MITKRGETGRGWREVQEGGDNVYLWLIRVVVYQKPQRYKASTLKFKKKKIKRERKKKIFTIELNTLHPKKTFPAEPRESVDCLWQAKPLLSLCNCSYEKEIIRNDLIFRFMRLLALCPLIPFKCDPFVEGKYWEESESLSQIGKH